jgi:hypothetical protein
MFALGIELSSRTKIFIPFFKVKDFTSSALTWANRETAEMKKMKMCFISNPIIFFK